MPYRIKTAYLAPVAIFLAAAFLAVTGCTSPAGRPTSRSAPGFDEAMTAYLQGNYSGAARQFEKLYRRPGLDQQKAHTGLFLGRSLLQTTDLSRAQSVLQRTGHLSRFPAVAGCARLAEAEAATRRGRYREAIHLWRALIAHPKLKDFTALDTALFRLAECYEAVGEPRKAKALYREIVRNFDDVPTSHVLASRRKLGLPTTRGNPTAGAFGSYYIQVAALKNTSNLRVTGAKLRRMGLKVNLKKGPSGLTLIRVGPYTTRGRANGTLGLIRRSGFPTAFVTGN